VAGQAASGCRIRLFQIMNRLAETLIDTLHSCPIPETTRLGRTLRQWRDQILAYVATGGVNNGGTKALNLIIDKTRRGSPRLPQLTQLPTMHPARITQNPAVPTTTHPCLIPKSRLERSRNSQSSTGSWSGVGVPIRWRPAVHG
jgi:hypothetical protein